MFDGFGVTLSPIGPWPVLVGLATAVLVLTLWAYSRRLRGSTGRWRWVALTLRLLALLLCLLAALRPSVLLKEKKRQAASLVVLMDSSTSMLLSDEVGGKTRWHVGTDSMNQVREFGKSLGPDLDVKFFRFDSNLSEPKEAELTEDPKGRETRLGTAMLDVQKRQESTSRRIARMIRLLGLCVKQRSQSPGRRPAAQGTRRTRGDRRPRDRERGSELTRYQVSRYSQCPDCLCEESARGGAARWWHEGIPARRSTSSSWSRASPNRWRASR